MTGDLVDRIVEAVLYEGYVLYPYRPSAVKNRQRWTFGAIYPRTFSEYQGGTDAWTMQTECLVRGGEDTRLDVQVRCLHVVARTIGELLEPLGPPTNDDEPRYRPVPSLRVDGRLYQSWDEAVERVVGVGERRLGDLVARACRVPVSVPAGRSVEPLRDASGVAAGVAVREHDLLEGEVVVTAQPVGAGLFRVAVRVDNTAPCAIEDLGDRERALRRTFVATHPILRATGGELLSLTDPPEDAREEAAACRNAGTWPVLVGEPGSHNTLLSSPIILEDYPQIAQESPGSLFDGTEIDEILTLRILALTDEEKEEMRAADERTRAMLDRTESLTAGQLLSMHGAMRNLRALRREDDR